MAEPKINTAFSFVIGLVDQSARPSFKANPTLAAGDFKISIDGGALANLATLPTIAPAGSRGVLVALSASEMNGTEIRVEAIDAAGAEWDDVIVTIHTLPVTIEDVGGRIPAALVSGRIDASVGSMAANVLGAAQLAADAVTEIQSGLATASALSTVQADTDDIQARLPAALVSGRMDSSIGAMEANVLTASALAADATSEISGDVDTVLTAAHGAGSWAAGGGLTTQDVRDAMKLAPTAGAPAAGSVDEHLDFIQEDTEDIQIRLPVADAAVTVFASVGAMAANTVTAASLATDAVTEIDTALTASHGAGTWTSGPTASAIASAILDEVLAGHFVSDSVGEALTLIRGLLQQHYVLDATVYNSDDLLLGGRLRLFSSAALVDASTDGGSGEGDFASFTVTAVAEPGFPRQIKTYKVKRST